MTDIHETIHRFYEGIVFFLCAFAAAMLIAEFIL
jgi:hypothetical protein